MSVRLCQKSTGSESRLVVWHSHWECWIDTGCWWQTRKGSGGHLQKGSGWTWDAASRPEFAANRYFLSHKHYKRSSDTQEELKLEVRGALGSFIVVGEKELRLHFLTWDKWPAILSRSLHCPVCTSGRMHMLTLALLLKILVGPVLPLPQVVIRQHGPFLLFCCLREIEFLYILKPLRYFATGNYLF